AGWVTFLFVGEVLIFGIAFLVMLPGAWLGDRWDRVLLWFRRLILAGIVLFLAVLLVGVGTDIPLPHASGPSPSPRVPEPPAMLPAPIAPFSWAGWFHAHAAVLAAGGVIGSFFTKLAESVVSEWLKKRFVRTPEKAPAPERIIPLYG